MAVRICVHIHHTCVARITAILLLVRAAYRLMEAGSDHGSTAKGSAIDLKVNGSGLVG